MGSTIPLAQEKIKPIERHRADTEITEIMELSGNDELKAETVVIAIYSYLQKNNYNEKRNQT